MRSLLQFSLLVALTLQLNFAVAQNNSTETAQLETIAWSPDGTRIAGSYGDARVSVWGVDNLSNPILSFQTELADKITWTPDSHYLIAQGNHSDENGHLQSSVTKWDADTGEFVDTLFAFELDTTFEFNPYGYYIVPTLALDSTTTKAAFSFRNVTVYLSDGTQVLHPNNQAATHNVYRMEWSPDGERLAIVNGATDIYTIEVFDIASGDVIQVIVPSFQYYITDLGWDTTGNYLAASSMQFTCCESWSNIGVYHVQDAEALYSYDAADRWWGNIARYDAPVAWHPTDFLLAIANVNTVEIYDPNVENALFTIAVDEARDIEWSPDGTQIASVSSNGVLELWDVPFFNSNH
ncbi:MAG: WD40 repeat domain-containing protein [Burkholderiales bacterium]|nr:WD40 repeat domain-containing protein [Anaerolineae bacterium]